MTREGNTTQHDKRYHCGPLPSSLGIKKYATREDESVGVESGCVQVEDEGEGEGGVEVEVKDEGDGDGEDQGWGYKTRHDKTRQDKTRQDKTRQDKTRHDKTSVRHDRHNKITCGRWSLLSLSLSCLVLSCLVFVLSLYCLVKYVVMDPNQNSKP
jgi:hypothetical protein